jgi:hypothetical protein
MTEEQFKWEEALKENIFREQKQNRDFNEDMEKCDDCGSYLDSHDHCPLCDY